MRARAHAPLAFWRQRGDFALQSSTFIEQLFGLVTLHPLFENLYVSGIAVHFAHGNLMGAPVIFRALAVDLLWTRPAFRATQHDHGPARPVSTPLTASCFTLDLFNLINDPVHDSSHQLMHLFRFMPFDEIGRVAIAAKQLLQLLVTDPRQHRGTGDLITV